MNAAGSSGDDLGHHRDQNESTVTQGFGGSRWLAGWVGPSGRLVWVTRVCAAPGWGGLKSAPAPQTRTWARGFRGWRDDDSPREMSRAPVLQVHLRQSQIFVPSVRDIQSEAFASWLLFWLHFLDDHEGLDSEGCHWG